MRRWFVPLTVAGVGMLLLSERGRNALRALLLHFRRASGDLGDDLQRELDGIQAMLDGIAESLGLRPETGH